MSARESHDIDLENLEQKQLIGALLQEDQLIEFKEKLEEAFFFANKEAEIPEDLIFSELRGVFRDYFDKCDMIISKGYTFNELSNTLIKDRG